MSRRKKIMQRCRSALLLCSCSPLLIYPLQNASAIGLKEQSVVTGDKITLGDVFYDLPKDEDHVLGIAPKPGQEMVLNARTLLRIALALELPWRPASTMDQVTVKREATIIDKDMIEQKLTEALAVEGVSGDFMLNIPVESQKIMLPSDQIAALEVTKIFVDSGQKSFQATVMAPSAENPLQVLQIKGQIQPVIEVPVLKASIQNGQIITEYDIEYKKIRDVDFTADVVTSIDQLVGMTARRMIPAGRPIRENETLAQQIVGRGELILLRLETGPLSLTTQGKALENGAKGDVVRVLNTASNQTVQGIVTGNNEVSIAAN
jgi:flagella basal body P-ring formation protein FlgA